MLRTLLALVLTATAVHAECYPSLEHAANAMARKIGQVPKWIGQPDTPQRQGALVLFISPTTHHWTFVMQQGQKYCVTMTGNDSRWATPGLPS